VEWSTMGSGVPGCMHGGGSPDGAKLVIRASADLEKKVEIARRLAHIDDSIPDPKK
jgi:4-hydroxybutyryl-CoA dehydratase/vinylacetyl-CoA-Delta-isomerase